MKIIMELDKNWWRHRWRRAEDSSGSSVSLSSDGSVLAIGATDNDGNGDESGHVRIYQNINNDWVKIGDDIDGEAAGDQSGFQLAFHLTDQL